MAWTKPAPSGKVKGCWRDHTGKERSKTCATKTEALKYAKRMEMEVEQGIRRNADAGRQKFGEYLTDWLEHHHKLRANSRIMYEGTLRRYVLPSRLARYRLNEIEPRHVREWIAEQVKTGKPAASVQDAYQYVLTALYTAVNDDVIPKNPAIRLGKFLPEVHVRVKRQPSREEVDAIAQVISPPWYRVAVLVLGYAGIRQGELAVLEPRDIDAEEGCLWITRQLLISGEFGPPKNEKRRLLSPARIQPWLLEEINQHIDAGYTCEYQGKTLVFSSGYPGARPDGGRPWEKYGIDDPVAWVGDRRQQDAADEIGVQQTTVSEWLMMAKTGSRRPSHRPKNPAGLVRRPFSRVGFFVALKEALDELSLPPAIRAHDLRGACTSWLINEMGWPIQIVAAQIGDDPMTLYKSYGQVTPDMHRLAIQGLPIPGTTAA
jgi:integrase